MFKGLLNWILGREEAGRGNRRVGESRRPPSARRAAMERPSLLDRQKVQRRRGQRTAAAGGESRADGGSVLVGMVERLGMGLLEGVLLILGLLFMAGKSLLVLLRGVIPDQRPPPGDQADEEPSLGPDPEEALDADSRAAARALDPLPGWQDDPDFFGETIENAKIRAMDQAEEALLLKDALRDQAASLRSHRLAKPERRT